MSKPSEKPMHYGASPLIFVRAKKLRRRMTNAEKILWTELNNRKLGGYKFRRQHPASKYILDYYCHEVKLVIELDGSIHDNKVQQFYDEDRTNNLEAFGIKVIRFENELVEENIEFVKAEILRVIESIKLAGEL